MSDGEIIEEFILEPGTGKAIEILQGQKLRIEQLEGGQCADFNCFNLHDYKEFFHTGRTRHMHGLHPTKGDFLWSAPPRERPMMYILEDTTGTNDVLYPRCSAFLYEFQYGLPVHTNCHDMQAEAQREFGLTPDDVHDSFNFFMHTGVDSDGRPYIARQTAKKGDYVELIAMFDVLAVPNVCGADVMATSDFSFKPLRIVVSMSNEAEREMIPRIPILGSQRKPKDFRNAVIKADRELQRDLSYRPEFINYPIQTKELEITLSDEEYEALQALKGTGNYGKTDGEALRYIFFSWWIEKFMKGPKHFEDLKT